MLFYGVGHLALDFVRKCSSLIQSPQRVGDDRAIHGHSAIGSLFVYESSDQAFNVPVKYYPDKVAIAIDHRRPRVPADDIGSAHEVERRGQSQPVPSLLVPLRQIERRLVVKAIRSIVQAIDRGSRGSYGAVHRVALHRSI